MTTTVIGTQTDYKLATIGTRFVAIVIDGIILGFFTGILLSTSRNSGGLFSILLGLAYHWFFLTRQDGQTLGKMIMKIRVVKVDGSPISDTDAIMRFAGYYVNSIAFMIGWIWVLFDDKNQGWHDKIANTIVVTE